MYKCKKCGNKEIVIEKDSRSKDEKPFYYAICDSITCGLNTQNFPTKEEALENWNYWNNPEHINILEKTDRLH